MAEAGYIVVSHDGLPLMLCKGYDEAIPILLLGDSVSVFSRRQDARNAIRRTVRYARRNGYEWGWGHRIKPLEKPDD